MEKIKLITFKSFNRKLKNNFRNTYYNKLIILFEEKILIGPQI